MYVHMYVHIYTLVCFCIYIRTYVFHFYVPLCIYIHTVLTRINCGSFLQIVERIHVQIHMAVPLLLFTL